MTYRKEEKKEKKKKWDSFRKQLKDEFKKTKENVKETLEDIKKQFNEVNKPPQNISKKNKNNIKKKPIDPNLELFCPFCEYPIPKELKPLIKDSDSIVCENCGTEIKKNSFFKKDSFPD